MNLVCGKNINNLTSKDTLVVFLSEEDLKKKKFQLKKEISHFFENLELSFFKGNMSEVMFFPISGKPNLILCGLGPREGISSESLRTTASEITACCREKEIPSVDIYLPEIEGLEEAETVRALSEGICLSNYSFYKYKTAGSSDKKSMMKKAVFYSDDKKCSKILIETGIISENIFLCRNMVNDTSEFSSPVSIAKEAKKISSLKGISCRVYGKDEIKKMGMGLILAVNKGSSIPPQLVVLNYKGNPGSRKTTALVGKGITFDSGGMNLKPSGHIETMRLDMAGGATVLYTIKAAAELKLKINIYAVIPLTENMISNSAYRPGDIFKSYKKSTVEIGNTDAEGRLILADALSFTEDRLKPDFIIDIATLTGSCVMTFGETVAGMMSNDDSFAEKIEESAALTGEKIWRLPFFNDYEEIMKSDIADIKNIPPDRNAGSISAGVFLKHFIDKTKWAHIDIAGTAWYSKARGYMPKYATGFGIRLLIDIIKKLDTRKK